ncbi:MAG: PAS domain-containing protein [Pseudomonadota bacterium]
MRNLALAATDRADEPEHKPNFNQDAAIVAALKEVYTFIEFSLDGTIVNANDHFLRAMGYRLADVLGRHHRIFMPPDEVDCAAYRAHWVRVGRGEVLSGRYRRVRKDGQRVRVAASYAPMRDANGILSGAFKIVVDMTEDYGVLRAL